MKDSLIYDDPRIVKLPQWVQNLIERLQTAHQPLKEEVTKVRQQLFANQQRMRRLQDSNEALLEILRAAGKGGMTSAAEVVQILESYEIYQPSPPEKETSHADSHFQSSQPTEERQTPITNPE